MKPAEAQKLVEIAKEYLWPAFARDATFFGKTASIIESGEGRHFTDIFGNRLLEPNSCGGAAPLGFNVPELVDAMIAMSTHGRSGVSRWALGSVTDKVLRGGKIPVLTVRAPKG